MFKIFPGYDLVESYHNWKKAHRTDDKTVSRIIRLAVAILAALLIWCLPVENWIVGMTRKEPWRFSSLPFSCGSLRLFRRGQPLSWLLFFFCSQPLTAVWCSSRMLPLLLWVLRQATNHCFIASQTLSSCCL